MNRFSLEDVETFYRDQPGGVLEAFASLVEESMPIRSMLFLPFRPGTHDFSRIGTQAYRIVEQYIDMYFERYMKMAPAFSTRESIKRMKPNRLYFVNRYIPDSICMTNHLS